MQSLSTVVSNPFKPLQTPSNPQPVRNAQAAKNSSVTFGNFRESLTTLTPFQIFDALAPIVDNPVSYKHKKLLLSSIDGPKIVDILGLPFESRADFEAGKAVVLLNNPTQKHGGRIYFFKLFKPVKNSDFESDDNILNNLKKFVVKLRTANKSGVDFVVKTNTRKIIPQTGTAWSNVSNNFSKQPMIKGVPEIEIPTSPFSFPKALQEFRRQIQLTYDSTVKANAERRMQE